MERTKRARDRAAQAEEAERLHSLDDIVALEQRLGLAHPRDARPAFVPPAPKTDGLSSRPRTAAAPGSRRAVHRNWSIPEWGCASCDPVDTRPPFTRAPMISMFAAERHVAEFKDTSDPYLARLARSARAFSRLKNSQIQAAAVPRGIPQDYRPVRPSTRTGTRRLTRNEADALSYLDKFDSALHSTRTHP